MESRPPARPSSGVDALQLAGAALGAAAGTVVVLVCAGASSLAVPVVHVPDRVLRPVDGFALAGAILALVAWTALWYAAASAALLRSVRHGEGMRAAWTTRPDAPTPASPDSGGRGNHPAATARGEGASSDDRRGSPSSARRRETAIVVAEPGEFARFGVDVETLPRSIRLRTSPGALDDVPPVVHLDVRRERFARGVLVGTAAAVDGGVWALLGPAGWVVGAMLAAVGLGAAVPRIGRDRRFQAALGWSAWLRPMAWPATGVGVVLFVLNVPFALAAGGRGALRLDRSTGTVETTGGWPIGIAGFRGGFDLGGFSFVTRAAPTPFDAPGLSAHETGHTLNVAALGAIVHWLGALEENVAPARRHWRAYAELLAESHLPRPGRVVVGMWN